MERKRLAILTTCLMLGSCASASYTHSEKAAEVMAHPLVTTTGGFLARPGSGGGIFNWDGDLEIYLYSNQSESNPNATTLDRCSPASLAVYDSDPGVWQKSRHFCPELFFAALPIGTVIQVDSISWSWDFENGDKYSIQGHFVDPKLGKDEFNISRYYFVTPEHSPDQRMHLDPKYFAVQSP